MFVDFKCRHENTSKRLLQPLTCVAGVQRGERGKLNSTAKRDRWNLEGNICKDVIVFFVFLRPVDERKNADWSELIRSTYKPLFCFVRYSLLIIYVISMHTAGVRRSLLLATSSRKIVIQ